MSSLILRMWASLLVAMLFGLLFGWLIWGSLVRRLRRELEQAAAQATLPEEPPEAIELKAMAAAAGFNGDAVPREDLGRILNSLFEPLDPDAIAQRAFEFSQQRGFQNGTEQEDWLKAERQLHNERLEAARDKLTSG